MQYTHSSQSHFGARFHTVLTSDAEFANRLYEEALKIDDPECLHTEAGHLVYFVADEPAALSAISSALTNLQGVAP